MAGPRRGFFFRALLCSMFLLLLQQSHLVLANEAGGSSGNDSPKEQSVGKIRSNADAAFANGEIDQSLKLWTKVIELEPKNENNYYKRFRVYLRQHKLREALSDLSSAIEIKPDFENALAQRAKLNMKLGKCTDADKDFIKLKNVNPGNKELSMHKDAYVCSKSIKDADTAFANGNWELAKEHYNNVLKFTDSAPQFLLKRAQCWFHLKDFYEVIIDTGKLLKLEPDNIPALELRGKSYYMIGEFDAAMNHYRLALKYDPEHNGCKTAHKSLKKIQGNLSKAKTAMEKKDYEAVVTNLLSVLKADPQHKTIAPQANMDLAEAYLHLKKYKLAEDAARAAIAFDGQNAQAHHILGRIFLDNDEFEEAVNVLKKAKELDNNDHKIDENLRRAEAALKQSQRKDYYKILGLSSRKATSKEIKKAYRDLALQWHPDKHQGEEAKAKAEKMFQSISEAYEVLSDDEKRRMYDLGEDPNNPNNNGNQQHHGHHFNPFQHFQHGGPQFGGGQQQFHFRFG